jgi:ABC-type lipoprotein release transport system permease subunit|tara:strand:+ start:181 stop:510 length:330 start_codon:yes stop_codon:yes gene_type:complete
MATANDNKELAKLVNPEIRKIKSKNLKIQKLQSEVKDGKAQIESILNEFGVTEITSTSGKALIVQGSESERISGKVAIGIVKKLLEKHPEIDEDTVITISTSKGYLKIT